MGLENAPDGFSELPCSIQGGPYLGGMVGIVVDYGNSADLSFLLKTALGTCTAKKSGKYCLIGNAKGL